MKSNHARQRKHKNQGVGPPASKSSSLAVKLERVEGIEPSYSAWKAAALPLSYTRF